MGAVIQGPFFNFKEAAAYCGWSPHHFRRVLQGYALPRFGPKQNRYARSTLDSFMTNPEAFRSRGTPRRRKPLTLVVPDERALR